MKKIIGMLLWGLLLVAAAGCAADAGENEMATAAPTVVKQAEETVLEQETADATDATDATEIIIRTETEPETEAPAVTQAVPEVRAFVPESSETPVASAETVADAGESAAADFHSLNAAVGQILHGVLKGHASQNGVKNTKFHRITSSLYQCG